MIREDKGMPFLLRYENVAWYENGQVRILDRRVYPREVKFVNCKTYKERQDKQGLRLRKNKFTNFC